MVVMVFQPILSSIFILCCFIESPHISVGQICFGSFAGWHYSLALSLSRLYSKKKDWAQTSGSWLKKKVNQLFIFFLQAWVVMYIILIMLAFGPVRMYLKECTAILNIALINYHYFKKKKLGFAFWNSFLLELEMRWDEISYEV